jgi:hypothetical protein
VLFLCVATKDLTLPITLRIIVSEMILKGQDIIHCKCNQCGHKWIPRMPVKSVKICPNPKCHSVYWDERKRSKR